MFERLFNYLERSFWGENTWAMAQGMTFWQRWLFYRDTAVWPGQFSKETTALGVGSDIKKEMAEGKTFCANQKLSRAESAGLDIL